jgi:hypothetical protein
MRASRNGLNLSDREHKRTLLESLTTLPLGSDGEVAHFSFHGSRVVSSWSLSDFLLSQLSTDDAPVRTVVLRGEKKRADAACGESR